MSHKGISSLVSGRIERANQQFATLDLRGQSEISCFLVNLVIDVHVAMGSVRDVSRPFKASMNTTQLFSLHLLRVLISIF